jgi:hypothetical protein
MEWRFGAVRSQIILVDPEPQHDVAPASGVPIQFANLQLANITIHQFTIRQHDNSPTLLPT